MANTRDWKTKFSIKYHLITFSLNHTLFSAFSARPDRAFPTVFSTQYPRNGNGWAWGRGCIVRVTTKTSNQKVNIWHQLTLNTVLACGDNLYSAVSQSINKNYLSLTDVPWCVGTNKSFFIQKTVVPFRKYYL